MFKKIKCGIMAVLVCSALLSGCGDSPPSDSVTETVTEQTTVETTTEYTEEELEQMVQDMPEIVFVLAYQKEGYNILGCYVTNTGAVKLFDFRTTAPDVVYDVRDVYDRLEEVTCQKIEPLNPSMSYEERLITEDELTALTYDVISEYYKILLTINGDAEYVKWDYSLDSTKGCHLLYGIKTNDYGKKECILLRGYGTDSEYLHNNPDAEYLYALLFKCLPKFKNNTAE